MKPGSKVRHMEPKAAAERVGAVVARWCRSAASYKLLDKYITADTWMAGGCVALAFGLASLLPGAQVVGLARRWREELILDHVGVLWGGGVIDAGGAHADMDQWAAWFERKEGAALLVDSGVVGSVIPCSRWKVAQMELPNDMSGADEVADALRARVMRAVLPARRRP